MAGVALFGAFYGLAYTAGEALLSDSIPDGGRSKILTKKTQYMSAGTCLGPAVAIVMFAILGNNWSVHDCMLVILAGQIIFIPALVMLWTLDDDKATLDEQQPVVGDDNSRLLDVTSEKQDHDESQQEKEEKEEEEDDDEPPAYSRRVPIIIATSDLISGLASGMSIRFFPIFFYENLSLSPITVQALYIISPLVIIYLSKAARKISTTKGRCETAVMFKWIGISSMAAMLLCYHYELNVYIVLFFYLLRTTTMNCNKALTTSQLYDHVPRSERGRFTVLESINMFSWSGSAAVGGVLVGKIGIVGNFIATGSLQVSCASDRL
jgi:MFS family permease